VIGLVVGRRGRNSVDLTLELVGVTLAFGWKVVQGRTVAIGVLAARASRS
jgi:hypothetical protein